MNLNQQIIQVVLKFEGFGLGAWGVFVVGYSLHGLAALKAFVLVGQEKVSVGSSLVCEAWI